MPEDPGLEQARLRTEVPLLRAAVGSVAGASILVLGNSEQEIRWLIEQGADGRRLVWAEIEHLPLRRDLYDLVVSSLVLHGVNDLERTLALIASLLAPGGRLVFSVPHPLMRGAEHYGSDALRQRLSPDTRQLEILRMYLSERCHFELAGRERQRRWARIASRIVMALLDAGLVPTGLDEPEPCLPEPDDREPLRSFLEAHRRFPLYLIVTAVRPTS
jgi:SAM-dependent methyltransferase